MKDLSMALKKACGPTAVRLRVFHDLGSFYYPTSKSRGKREYVYRKALLVWWYYDAFGEIKDDYGVITLSFAPGSSCRKILEAIGFDNFPKGIKHVGNVVKLFQIIQEDLDSKPCYMTLEVERKKGYIVVNSANRVVPSTVVPDKYCMSLRGQAAMELYSEYRKKCIDANDSDLSETA